MRQKPPHLDFMELAIASETGKLLSSGHVGVAPATTGKGPITGRMRMVPLSGPTLDPEWSNRLENSRPKSPVTPYSAFPKESRAVSKENSERVAQVKTVNGRQRDPGDHFADVKPLFKPSKQAELEAISAIEEKLSKVISDANEHFASNHHHLECLDEIDARSLQDTRIGTTNTLRRLRRYKMGTTPREKSELVEYEMSKRAEKATALESMRLTEDRSRPGSSYDQTFTKKSYRTLPSQHGVQTNDGNREPNTPVKINADDVFNYKTMHPPPQSAQVAFAGSKKGDPLYAPSKFRRPLPLSSQDPAFDPVTGAILRERSSEAFTDRNISRQSEFKGGLRSSSSAMMQATQAVQGETDNDNYNYNLDDLRGGEESLTTSPKNRNAYTPIGKRGGSPQRSPLAQNKMSGSGPVTSIGCAKCTKQSCLWCPKCAMPFCLSCWKLVDHHDQAQALEVLAEENNRNLLTRVHSPALNPMSLHTDYPHQGQDGNLRSSIDDEMDEIDSFQSNISGSAHSIPHLMNNSNNTGTNEDENTNDDYTASTGTAAGGPDVSMLTRSLSGTSTATSDSRRLLLADLAEGEDPGEFMTTTLGSDCVRINKPMCPKYQDYHKPPVYLESSGYVREAKQESLSSILHGSRSVDSEANNLNNRSTATRGSIRANPLRLKPHPPPHLSTVNLLKRMGSFEVDVVKFDAVPPEVLKLTAAQRSRLLDQKRREVDAIERSKRRLKGPKFRMMGRRQHVPVFMLGSSVSISNSRAPRQDGQYQIARPQELAAPGEIESPSHGGKKKNETVKLPQFQYVGGKIVYTTKSPPSAAQRAGSEEEEEEDDMDEIEKLKLMFKSGRLAVPDEENGIV